MAIVPFIIIGGFILLVLLAVLFGEKGPPRESVLQDWAAGKGLRFKADRDPGFRERFPQFGQFQRGSDRFASNTITGQLPLGDGGPPLECLAGDYHYETEETRTRKVGDREETYTETVEHDFSYVLVRPPFAVVGDLSVRPESFLDRIGAFFGFDDIDFESAEFSRAFSVNSKDKRFAYDVINPRMMQYLLDTRPDSFEIEGGYLLVASGWRWKPEEFDEKLQWAAGFFGHWPRHLQSEQTLA